MGAFMGAVVGAFFGAFGGAFIGFLLERWKNCKGSLHDSSSLRVRVVISAR
jgi:hypothetical protein